MRIEALGGEEQRRIPDHQDGLVGKVRQRVEIARFRAGLREVRVHSPDVGAQELEEADRRPGGRGEQHRAPLQLPDRPSAEQGHAPDRPVA